MVDISDAGGDYDDPDCGSAVASCCRSCERPSGWPSSRVRFATGEDPSTRRSVARVGGEIANLVNAGLSPLAAIQAATIGGAELLGIAARTGSLAPDMEADLIAVDGNPLDRIWVLQNPLLVMSNGQIALNALDPSK